jgi:hypothetical protein
MYSLGTGFNFLWDRPDVKWRTRLALDHSLLFQNALFVGLTVDIKGGKIAYASTVKELREYLNSVLAELDLVLPPQ